MADKRVSAPFFPSKKPDKGMFEEDKFDFSPLKLPILEPKRPK